MGFYEIKDPIVERIKKHVSGSKTPITSVKNFINYSILEQMKRDNTPDRSKMMPFKIKVTSDGLSKKDMRIIASIIIGSNVATAVIVGLALVLR